jgi:hypothetical protein
MIDDARDHERKDYLLLSAMNGNYCDLRGLTVDYCARYNTCSIELRWIQSTDQVEYARTEDLCGSTVSTKWLQKSSSHPIVGKEVTVV